MKKIIFISLLFLCVLGYAQSEVSPNKNINLEFKLSPEGKPTYSITYKSKQIVSTSNLGITLKESQSLEANFA
jgi:hypothetical protein